MADRVFFQSTRHVGVKEFRILKVLKVGMGLVGKQFESRLYRVPNLGYQI